MCGEEGGGGEGEPCCLLCEQSSHGGKLNRSERERERERRVSCLLLRERERLLCWLLLNSFFFLI